MNTANDLAAILRDGMQHSADRGHLLNEAATLSLLIRPALNALGYPATHRIPEYGEARNRLDEACFLNAVTATPGHAAIIVEAKQRGSDFDRTPAGQGRYGSPDRQIQRYLRQHIASGPDTIGALTDGVKWRIYRRTANPTAPDVEFVAEYNFQALAQAGQGALPTLEPVIQEQLGELVDRLARANIAYRTVPGALLPPANPADTLFAAVAENQQPEHILRQLLNEPDAVIQSNLLADVGLQGVRKDAHDRDWAAYAYAAGVAIATDKPDLAGSRATIAVVQYRHHGGRDNAGQANGGRGLSRPDTALCARAFASAGPANTAVVFLHGATPDGGLEARLAVAAGGQVNMTAAFDPTLPSPAARAATARLLELLRDAPSEGLTAGKLQEPLEAASLRQQFYREVAQWTGRMQQGQPRPRRQAVLRHLVRVMFTWILKEESIIPPELFERAFSAAHLDDLGRYHSQVLRFLFHQRLNVPDAMRSDHPVAAIQQAMADTPFLNGSLFAAHQDDDELDIPPSAYWNTDAGEPGLFTILSRYHWTLDEHRPGESEQTLDPELLSNLFERLITPTEEGSEPPLRQPAGTYYTPADVADEMVKDALSAAVRDYAPPALTDSGLLALFGSADAPLPTLAPDEQARLADRIKELRIFDPAVGSGEFLFSALLALQRALGKLEPDAANPAAGIIRRQLAGQDIHPLAVQIARLRLFIAITAARRNDPGEEPLPNLEARIVCADTLATVADPQWRPDRPDRLDTADPELIAALTAVAENRAQWFDAHTEEAKQALLAEDAARRDRLSLLLQRNGELASPELVNFADAPLFNINPAPAQTDARLLFYESPWHGFDVVISNPPYEGLSKSMTRKQIDSLKKYKGYQTTNVGDLYSLFCEAALSLAKLDGGVVTLIVPLSIASGQRQRTLRNAFNSRSKRINLRHHHSRPDTTFNTSPTVRNAENRVRSTIVTAVTRDTQELVISSTALQSWASSERGNFLSSRQLAEIPHMRNGLDRRIASQWPRIPTKEVSNMVSAIIGQGNTIESYKTPEGVVVAFPQVAYQFIGSIPHGAVQPRSEHLLTVADMDTLRLIVAALNGHVGFGWWRVFGDGFHTNAYELTSMTIPDAWVENPEPAIRMGDQLIESIPECIVETNMRGTTWRSVNFHLKPELIEELDRLHIAALGLPVEPLLTHLRIMRSSSSWNYEVGG